MDFEDFEGFKKILNEKNLSINTLYGLLNNYIDQIGNISLIETADENSIEIKINLNIKIIIYIKDKYIIIERKSFEKENLEIGTEKSVVTAQTDRLIEQIYDLINDYMPDGIISEPITKYEKVYFMNQIESKKALGLISVSNQFIITDEHNKELYKVSQNVLNHLYSVINSEKKREEFSISYKDLKESKKYSLVIPPFTKIDISKKDDNKIKTIYIGKIDNKDIKISADYTDNHYIIEVDEIVVGAVDCLDETKKTQYRLEINNSEYTRIIIAVAIISDIDNIIVDNKLM